MALGREVTSIMKPSCCQLILRFKDSQDQTTNEYILPTEEDAKDMMTCIMNSIIDNGTRLDVPSADLSKIDYTVMNFVHRAQQ